jgi:hypothetical protein
VLAKLDKVTNTGAGCATPLAILILCAVVLYLNYHPCPAVAPDANSAPAPRPNPIPQPIPAPSPGPGQQPPLILVAREYVQTLPTTCDQIADKADRGDLASKKAILEAFAAHGAPLGETLSHTLDTYCDAVGNVTNKAGVKAILKQMGQATRAR